MEVHLHEGTELPMKFILKLLSLISVLAGIEMLMISRIPVTILNEYIYYTAMWSWMGLSAIACICLAVVEHERTEWERRYRQ